MNDNDSARKEMLIARAAMQRIELLHEVEIVRSAMANASGWRYWLSFAANNLSAMFLPAAARGDRGASAAGTSPIGMVEILLGILEMVLPKRRSMLRAVLRGFRLWQLGSHLFDQLRSKTRRAPDEAPEGAEPVAPEAAAMDPYRQAFRPSAQTGPAH